MTGFPILSALRTGFAAAMKSFGISPEMWLRGADLDASNGSQLSQPYKNSVWVQRAIKKVAGPIAAVELEFVNDGGEEVESPDLSAFWNEPAKGLSRADFIEASVGWLKLKGEYFWLLDDSTLVPYPEVVSSNRPPLIVARPDRMRHICDRQTGKLEGWEFTDDAGKRHALLPEQVIHRKHWNPYDPWRGLAEYLAAQVGAETDYASGLFARNLAQSNGDQGVFVVAKGGMPNDEQREQIKEQLRMKRRMQQSGKFVPVFLTGDIEVQDPKIKAPDGDFWTGRLATRHEIFLAFGVPPSMADKMESYSIGSASDWFILIFETCIPTAAKIGGGIDEVNRKLFANANTALKAQFDWDEHPVMQAVRRERLALADGLWGKGMSMQDINDYLRLGIKPFTDWEVSYLPFNVAPVGTAAEAKKPSGPEFTEPEEPDAYQEMLRALTAPVNEQSKSAVTLPLLFDLCCGPSRTGHHAKSGDAEEFQGKRPGRERKQWEAQMLQRLPTIRTYETKINRLLMEARSQVLAKLQSNSDGAKSTAKAGVADLMFDLVEFTAQFKTTMRGVATQALNTAGSQFFKEIGKDDPFSMAPIEVLNFLDQRENKLANVPQDIFDRVKGSLTEGVEGGESIAELSRRVRDEFNGMSKERSVTIAMTETAAAYGTGRHEAMRQAGITAKKWLTSGNANVRQAHRLMNGIKIPISDPFTVINPKTGESDQIMHPGDADGAPWNVINCHCVELAAKSGGEE